MPPKNATNKKVQQALKNARPATAEERKSHAASGKERMRRRASIINPGDMDYFSGKGILSPGVLSPSSAGVMGSMWQPSPKAQDGASVGQPSLPGGMMTAATDMWFADGTRVSVSAGGDGDGTPIVVRPDGTPPNAVRERPHIAAPGATSLSSADGSSSVGRVVIRAPPPIYTGMDAHNPGPLPGERRGSYSPVTPTTATASAQVGRATYCWMAAHDSVSHVTDLKTGKQTPMPLSNEGPVNATREESERGATVDATNDSGNSKSSDNTGSTVTGITPLKVTVTRGGAALHGGSPMHNIGSPLSPMNALGSPDLYSRGSPLSPPAAQMGVSLAIVSAVSKMKDGVKKKALKKPFCPMAVKATFDDILAVDPETMLLTDFQVQDMSSKFALFDTDESGVITQEEFGQALSLVGIEMPQDEMAQILAVADTNDDGQIDFGEFVVMASRERYALKERDLELIEVFEFLDCDMDDRISMRELGKMLKAGLGEELSREELIELMRCADPDGKGSITFEQFKHICTGDT